MKFVGCGRELPTPMGGDSLKVENGGVFPCSGTMTIGGVEDVDSVRGLIASGHGAAVTGSNFRPDYSQTGMRAVYGDSLFPLGTVFKMPTFSINDDGNRIQSVAAAFIAYPKDREPLAPLNIRGENGAIYTVIGSKEPVEGGSIWISGGRSGRPLKHTASETKVFVSNTDANGKFFSYRNISIPISDDEDTRDGDSGSPVYTKPDKNGNTHILGTLAGGFPHPDPDLDIEINTYTSWKDIEDMFNLKPVGK